MRQKVVVFMDSSNMGIINRLFEDGVFSSYQVIRVVDQSTDARKFVEEMRQRKNGKDHGGLTTNSCIVSIMQREPDKVWNYQELGVLLEEQFEFSSSSASPTLGRLTHLGYTSHVSKGNYMLTDKGKAHNQSEAL